MLRRTTHYEGVRYRSSAEAVHDGVTHQRRPLQQRYRGVK